ncbi:MAG: sigma-70 family RNA polymerase sigma factor [Solobacterium sp.]|nr:sigma-70 family RNA polymerase sigma factor [Solobacterium sp.]
MSLEEHVQFLIRCQFNAYCKKSIANRAAEIKRKNKSRWENEYYFEDLSPFDQERIQMVEEILEEEPTHYLVGGQVIPEKVLHKAIDSLPEKKRHVIHLYYFDELNDVEIAKMLSLSQKAVNYRRNRALEAIKQFLEEHKHDENE